MKSFLIKHAYIFPGQGSQFPGMGKSLYENNAAAKELFEQANEMLGFRISDLLFTGTEQDLKQTGVTQPAVFLHSIIALSAIKDVKPDMVAGHSLGEFSALAASKALSFEDALRLVSIRAKAMQRACDLSPSSMAAILGLDDAKAVAICSEIQEDTGEVVVAANFNCPGQLVISGSKKGIEIACQKMKVAGAKRALVLPVGGAFHSPLMKPAKEELASAIQATKFLHPVCPVYQNVPAKAVIDKEEIKKNLIDQLTCPVRWAQSVEAMVRDGATHFTEVGPGKVLQGLVSKIFKGAVVNGVG